MENKDNTVNFDELIASFSIEKEPKAVKEAPKKPRKEIKPKVEFTTEPLWDFLFNDIFAARKGHEHWKLNEKELIYHSKSFDAVLDRYLGILIEKAPELAAFVICELVLFTPRIHKSWKITKELQKKKKESKKT